MKKSKGFTLIELMIIISIFIIIIFGFGFIGVGIMGNYWYTQDNVLKEIRVDHPEIVEIIKDKRKIWSYSEIIVENKKGERQIFLLDTNCMFNYSLHLK